MLDFKAKINELKQEKTTLQDKAEGFINEGNLEEAKKINDQLSKINEQISVIENLAAHSEENAEPAKPEPKKEPEKLFTNFGEQLIAVYNTKKGIFDKRLETINNAVQGSNVGVGADGGFAVQEDFAGKILESAATTGEILSRVDGYTCSANSNAARWLQIDETDISETVFGGVQVFWTSEGHSVASSKPEFREMRLELEKMIGIAYVTEEMLQDASFISGFIGNAFTLAVQRLLESSIIGGNGAGKPLGILNSDALVVTDKENAQAKETVNAKNFLKMWSRSLFKNRKKTIWLLHPDLEEQLPEMKLSDDKLIWMPEGGISGSMYQTIFGRPVIYDDQCSEIGKKGDVMLADLSQYMLLRKGSARQDWSMHVEFLTDQQAFRIILRVNGAPKTNRPIKLKNSKFLRSPFVTLADRA